MPETPAVRAEAARLSARFQAAGALPFEADILQPAGTLLDLYGEDIRARAFTTQDPLRGERMLRPDFTVPLVLAHQESGAEAGCYTYAGEVFRSQEDDERRPTEYLQVGYERLGDADPAQADAEVFAQIHDALAGLPVQASVGDTGLLRAAVQGLTTTPERRAALMRHLWRPRRFRALLDRFGGRQEMPQARADLVAAMDTTSAQTLVSLAGVEIGKRRASEVIDRLSVLQADAQVPPLDKGELALLDDLMAVREAPEFALEHLRDIAVDLPSIASAVSRVEARLEALAGNGIDTSTLSFEASYGRTSLEYYDGFVFGFRAADRADLPPIATGGRYDALTAALGPATPAVGGVIRPGIVVQLREGALWR